MTGIFEVQDAIARKVLHALNLQLTVRPDPKYGIGIEAYDAYLRGMYHARTGDWDLAEEWYEKSAGLDPNNPDLWAERARHLHWQMYSGLAPNTGPLRQRHDEYIERALAIDPSHWARARRAIAMFLEDRQYQRAIDELVEIVSDHPNAYTSMMYLAQALGAIDRKSNSHYKAARRYSLLIRDYSMEQTMLVDSGRLEEAHQSIARNQGWAATYHAARLAAIEGDLDSLEALLNKKGMSHFFRTFFTALFSYLRDDFAQAREIISRAKRVSGYQPFLQKHYIALIERDLDGAVEYYAKAIDAFEGMAIIEHRDTCFMNRVFPEFVAYAPYQRILREIGLDSESAAEIKIPELPF
jgi:tetratricopeptide (TPR) repeat protein